MKPSNLLRKLLPSLILFAIFEAVAITLWLTKNNLFYLINGLTNTCRIDESEGDSVNVNGVFNRVASGTMIVADDGSIVFQELIE